MRIKEHPILDFKERSGNLVSFTFEGKVMHGYEGESIAAALHANGVKVYHTSYKDKARGFFCAIGKCSSCFMVVDGLPNVRTCIVPLRAGMKVEVQKGKGKFNV